MKKALLVVDMQNDFCPGGALGVYGGDAIVPVLNRYMEKFSIGNETIFLTRDWHPEKTKHFKAYGGIWPAHCVQNTKGAEFHKGMNIPDKSIIISKGMDPEKDSYSAFQGEDKGGKKLLDILRAFQIEELYIGGLATDYCVKYSAIDALGYGFRVKILTDAIKGVNLKPDDSDKAIQEITHQGALLVTFSSMSSRAD